MVYKNKGGQSRERTMVAAYSLVKDFGAKHAHVADALGCSQGTISNWVKEVGYKKEISGLQNEIADAQEYINEIHSQLPPPEPDYLEHDDFTPCAECGAEATTPQGFCSDCAEEFFSNLDT